MLLAIFKDKGDMQRCGNYRGIKQNSICVHSKSAICARLALGSKMGPLALYNFRTFLGFGKIINIPIVPCGNSVDFNREANFKKCR